MKTQIESFGEVNFADAKLGDFGLMLPSFPKQDAGSCG